MVKVGIFRGIRVLVRRMAPGRARDADVRASLKNPEEPSSEMADRIITPIALDAFAPSPAGTEEGEASAARLSSQKPPEPLGHPADMNASLDVLAEQMLTLVEVVSAQEKDIRALKARCQQLEEHDQAIMVAFTTFFHVLAAKQIARLEDISAILRNIIKVAQHEGHPEQSIRLLQRLATMLHEQTEAGVIEVHGPPGSEGKAS